MVPIDLLMNLFSILVKYAKNALMCDWREFSDNKCISPIT